MGGVDVITYVFNTITTTPDASSSSVYTGTLTINGTSHDFDDVMNALFIMMGSGS